MIMFCIPANLPAWTIACALSTAVSDSLTLIFAPEFDAFASSRASFIPLLMTTPLNE